TRSWEVDRRAAREACCDLLDASANQGIGAVEPSDGETWLFGRERLARRKVGREELEHPGAVRDRAGHRTGVVEARRERKAPLERHEAEGGLEADDPAAGGGNAERAAGVGAKRRVGEARRERGRRAAARAARDPAGRERV